MDTCGWRAVLCNCETINNILECCWEMCTARWVEDKVAGRVLIMHRTRRKWPLINISEGATL